MKQLGAAFQFNSANECADIISKLISDEPFRKEAALKAAQYILDNTGASRKIFNDICGNANPSNQT